LKSKVLPSIPELLKDVQPISEFITTNTGGCGRGRAKQKYFL